MRNPFKIYGQRGPDGTVDTGSKPLRDLGRFHKSSGTSTETSRTGVACRSQKGPNRGLRRTRVVGVLVSSRRLRSPPTIYRGLLTPRTSRVF